MADNTLVAVYSEWHDFDDHRIVTRRSSDGGATWSAPLELASSPDGVELTTYSSPQIAGRGTDVDVVWAWQNRIYYSTSSNGGGSFGSPAELAAPVRGGATAATVARRDDGLVMVAWGRRRAGVDRVQARISRDGGQSFSRSRVVTYGSDPRLAAGDSAIHLLYTRGYGAAGARLRVRISSDGARSWSEPTALADDAISWVGASIAAEGQTAVFAYSAQTPSESTYWVQARRTANAGATWSPPVSLTPKFGRDGLAPVVALKHGVAHFAFTRCHPNECDGSGGTDFVIFYRKSVNWPQLSLPEQVTTEEHAVPSQIAVADMPVVIYGEALVRLRQD